MTKNQRKKQAKLARNRFEYIPEINYIQTEQSWTVRLPAKLKGTYLAGEEPNTRSIKHHSNGSKFSII